MKRGDVYLADLNPTCGTEQAGVRPIVVVQHDALARFTRTVIAVPFTTNLRRTQVPGTVLVPAGEGGLLEDSVALCYQIAALDSQRLTRKLGILSESYLAALDQALKYCLNLG